MKIIVIGASHGIGFETVKEALKSGHHVTAFSRHASNLSLSDSKLKLVDGDVTNKESVEQAVKGHDVVICTLGLPTKYAMGPPYASRNYTLSKGTANIIAVMEKLGIKRFLCVTAIGSGKSSIACTSTANYGLRIGLRWLFKEKDVQEAMIEKSSLDWTLVRPTALTNSEKHRKTDDGKGKYGILSHISRRDVAIEMIAMFDDKSTYRKGPILSYKPRFGDTVRWTRGFLNID